jgi:hypothetical protein
MAYQSKAEQRMAGSTDYSASEGTLNSDSVKEMKDMGKAPEKIWSRTSTARSRRGRARPG